jgi:hydrogenase accessory protein HypB
MHQVLDLGINLLHANQHQADHNREHFDAWGVTCLNLMSAPGAGKTSLLEKTVVALAGSLRLAVIEGDMTTQLDAERLRRYGIPVIAINTGRACHLDAAMVAGGLQQLEALLDPQQLDLLLVENVGNLVCPAEFEVGEHAKVALLSVTEGEDKPLKYPIMFREADCLLITKVDLVPVLEVDLDRIQANIREINSSVPIFCLSAKTGDGLEPWLGWIREQILLAQHRRQPQ